MADLDIDEGRRCAALEYALQMAERPAGISTLLIDALAIENYLKGDDEEIDSVN